MKNKKEDKSKKVPNVFPIFITLVKLLERFLQLLFIRLTSYTFKGHQISKFIIYNDDKKTNK